jgi:hypothetical protein
MKVAALILAAALSLSANLARANALPEYSAEQKYAELDAIVIGRVAKVTRNTYDGSEYATIEVSVTVKGLVPRAIEVETVGAIAEWNLGVITGKDYTFYLKRVAEGKYMSIAGRNGVALYDPSHPMQ